MKISILVSLVYGLSLFLSTLSPLQAGPVTSPGPGSLDRKEILDEIRPRAEGQLGRPVEFVVTTMKVQDGWSFAEVKAQRPGGKSIPLNETIFGENDINSFIIFALLQDTSSGWMLIEYDLDPKEPMAMVWRQKYGLPATLF
jgi:hypothetical protein